MTVRELLYSAVFPEDPIADWGKAKLEAIIEKYKPKLRVYDEALLQHKLKDNVYYCNYAKMGGSGSIEHGVRTVEKNGCLHFERITYERTLW